MGREPSKKIFLPSSRRKAIISHALEAERNAGMSGISCYSQ